MAAKIGTVSASLPQALIERLRQQAEREDRSRSRIVRRALERELNDPQSPEERARRASQCR